MIARGLLAALALASMAPLMDTGAPTPDGGRVVAPDSLPPTRAQRGLDFRRSPGSRQKRRRKERRRTR